ncbi:MAG: glycosyltransferase family 39 protein [Thermomicrobiales bacterium]|nr:glycosyltransferase family 39 protein [Thermomicrobiales bacterium]
MVLAPRRERKRGEAQDAGWSKPVAWRVAALLLLAATFLLPRIVELDRMVTPDEPIWLARSANFYEALSSGDLKSTYQFAHPGVTVMWLGAAGYWWKANDYIDRIDGQISQRNNRVALILTDLGYEPLDIMVAGRTMIVLALTIVFLLSFLYALKLLPFGVALFGFLIMALDPFPLALSRLLHIDATAAGFMQLSVLAGSVYLCRGYRKRDLLVSGVAAGLAVLTRSQIGILAVWFAVMLLIDARDWRIAGGGWMASVRSCIRPLMIWGTSAFVTCVLLWPALWVDPIGTMRQMLDFAETAAIEGHENTVVFAGQLYSGDPGFQFYPTTFLWRATPPVIVGVVLAVALVIWSRRFDVPRVQRQIAISLLMAAASYGLLMSFAAKKFDRYLLPVYPLAALLAAWGIITAAQRIGRRGGMPGWLPAASLVTLTFVMQVSGVRATAPYYLSYYNPLLGGADAAPGSMMVGWGEGLDQVGAFLSELPDDASVVVATDAWPSALSYFTDGVIRNASFVDDPRGLYRWTRSDFYLLYVTSQSRGAVWQPWQDELANKEPALTVWLNGLEYARLYDLRGDAIPAFLEEGRSGMMLWPGIGRLVAWTDATAALPGSTIPVTLFFDQLDESALNGTEAVYEVRLQLTDVSGAIRSDVTAPLSLTDPGRHGQVQASLALPVPADTPLGDYSIELQVLNLQTGAPVQGFSFRYGERLAPTVVLDTLEITESLDIPTGE